MLRQQATPQLIPVPIVGSTKFGRYPKISREQTFNMLISDEMMVDTAGYAFILQFLLSGKGRDLYSSARGKIMVAVIENEIFSVGAGLTKSLVGQMVTSSGDVFIAENNNYEIGITDGVNLYVYNYGPVTPGFQIVGPNTTTGKVFNPATTKPGYITFQNGRFILGCNDTDTWQLSDVNNGTSFPGTAQYVGELQTKPDTVQGVVRFPGRGNLLFVLGKTVTEPWNDIGAALFPYQRISSFNVDYGCLNPETIAENENIIVWLAANEQSGPAIMYSTGTDIKKISTDGIDFLLSRLTHPEISYGFLFRQDGHQIYQITFPSPDDNVSYIYDFNTEKFFDVTDEDLNYHIAKKVVFFNNKYYFISFNDGNLYELSTNYTKYIYQNEIEEIPRIRILPPLRAPQDNWFIGKSLTFTVENGRPNNIITTLFPRVPFIGTPLGTEDGTILTTEDGIQICTETNLNTNVVQTSNMAIDLSISRDGGETFGNKWRMDMNPTGIRKSKINFQRLGQMNDCTIQLQFWGYDRFVIGNGNLEVAQ